MDIRDRLSAMAVQPDTHQVITHYADGRTRIHACKSLGAANNYAIGERRKIGRNLIDRETGHAVTVSAVTIEAMESSL